MTLTMCASRRDGIDRCKEVLDDHDHHRCVNVMQSARSPSWPQAVPCVAWRPAQPLPGIVYLAACGWLAAVGKEACGIHCVVGRWLALRVVCWTEFQVATGYLAW